MRADGICGIKNICYLRMCKNIRLEILVSIGYDRKVNQVRRDFVSDQVFGKSTDQGNTLFLRFLSPVGIPLNKSQAKILGRPLEQSNCLLISSSTWRIRSCSSYLYPRERFSLRKSAMCSARGPVNILFFDIRLHLHFQGAFPQTTHINPEIMFGHLRV